MLNTSKENLDVTALTLPMFTELFILQLETDGEIEQKLFPSILEYIIVKTTFLTVFARESCQKSI